MGIAMSFRVRRVECKLHHTCCSTIRAIYLVEETANNERASRRKVTRALVEEARDMLE